MPFASSYRWAASAAGLGVTLGVTLCVLALLATACSSAPEQAGPSGPAGGSAGFPTSVAGRFGTTTVPARPLRVVAMSWTDADLALGVGVVPVGMARVATQPDGVEPWTRTRLGPATPTLFDVANEDPIEAVAALAPDLILATKDYNLERSHAQLSQLAPVIAYGQAPNQESWEDAQKAATALGAQEAGQGLIASTTRRIADAAVAHRGFADRTFSFVVTPQPSGFYAVNSVDDASARFLSQLGLRIAPALNGQPTSSIPGRALLSWEKLGLADADLVFATGPPTSLALLRGMPAFPALPAVTQGQYLQLEPPLAQAIAFPSASSLQWAVDQITPRIAAALRA